VAIVDCQSDAYDVCIGRGRCPQTGRPGQRGNPFCVDVDGGREEVICRHGEWLWRGIEAGRVDRAALASLHGKRLGCRCAPRRCHGEVLEAAAVWAPAEQTRRLERRVWKLTRRTGSSGEAGVCAQGFECVARRERPDPRTSAWRRRVPEAGPLHRGECVARRGHPDPRTGTSQRESGGI
jgi:uncharacterized protein DUF4326